jgi:ATP-dependent DNA helicase RecG
MAIPFDDIKKWVADWEGPTLEFKNGAGKNVGKTICAFANTNGGIIVLGIGPEKQFIGIQNPDKASQDIHAMLESCKPKPNVEQQFVKEDGKTFIVLNITQFSLSQGACFFERQCFVRQGTTNICLDGDDLINFLKNKAVLNFEEQRTTAKLEQIDTKKLESLFKKRNIPEENLKGEKLKHILAVLHMANYNGEFYIKNAGLMFFAKEPELFFPNLQVRIVKYSGTEPELDKIELDIRVQGTIPELIDQTFIQITKNIGKQYIISGTKREENFIYPQNALREVITNALGHRDYFNTQGVLVEIFEDKIQMTNPGSLLQGQTIKNFYKTPQHRNPVCYQLLHDLGYGEGLGLGIRLIRKTMREYGLPDPEFYSLGNTFRIILYNNRSAKKVQAVDYENPRQKQALGYLKEKHMIKSEEYSKVFGVSVPTAINDLNELIKQGKVRKIGKFRGVYYELNV